MYTVFLQKLIFMLRLQVLKYIFAIYIFVLNHAGFGMSMKLLSKVQRGHWFLWHRGVRAVRTLVGTVLWVKKFIQYVGTLLHWNYKNTASCYISIQLPMSVHCQIIFIFMTNIAACTAFPWLWLAKAFSNMSS